MAGWGGGWVGCSCPACQPGMPVPRPRSYTARLPPPSPAPPPFSSTIPAGVPGHRHQHQPAVVRRRLHRIRPSQWHRLRRRRRPLRGPVCAVRRRHARPRHVPPHRHLRQPLPGLGAAVHGEARAGRAPAGPVLLPLEEPARSRRPGGGTSTADRDRDLTLRALPPATCASSHPPPPPTHTNTPPCHPHPRETVTPASLHLRFPLFPPPPRPHTQHAPCERTHYPSSSGRAGVHGRVLAAAGARGGWRPL